MSAPAIDAAEAGLRASRGAMHDAAALAPFAALYRLGAATLRTERDSATTEGAAHAFDVCAGFADTMTTILEAARAALLEGPPEGAP